MNKWKIFVTVLDTVIHYG